MLKFKYLGTKSDLGASIAINMYLYHSYGHYFKLFNKTLHLDTSSGLYFLDSGYYHYISIEESNAIQKHLREYHRETKS